VAIDVDHSCRFRGKIKIRVVPATAPTVRIGPQCQIGSDVVLVLGGGSLDLQRSVGIRDGVVLHVRGDIVFHHRSFISYYSVVHCDESVVIGARTGISEHCTLADSVHVPPPPGEWWYYHHVDTAPGLAEIEGRADYGNATYVVHG
jgi:carbonic anhydrase/acetyltransferase-like protein (isoleucine patch superfamily)